MLDPSLDVLKLLPEQLNSYLIERRKFLLAEVAFIERTLDIESAETKLRAKCKALENELIALRPKSVV